MAPSPTARRVVAVGTPTTLRTVGVLRRLAPAPLCWAAAGLAAVVVLRLHDPHLHGSYGQCLVLRFTGLPCPGCGGLRSIDDLSRGDVSAAVSTNLYVVASLAGLLAWWVAWLVSGLRGRPAPLAGRALPVALGWTLGFLAFGVLRLFGPFTWLQP